GAAVAAGLHGARLAGALRRRPAAGGGLGPAAPGAGAGLRALGRTSGHDAHASEHSALAEARGRRVASALGETRRQRGLPWQAATQGGGVRIAVVGGGPGGLYFAALTRQLGPGHEVTVWERNAPDDTFGFGVVFSDATLGGTAHADPATS